jgi:hypothetical protein
MGDAAFNYAASRYRAIELLCELEDTALRPDPQLSP